MQFIPITGWYMQVNDELLPIIMCCTGDGISESFAFVTKSGCISWAQPNGSSHRLVKGGDA